MMELSAKKGNHQEQSFKKKEKTFGHKHFGCIQTGDERIDRD